MKRNLVESTEIMFPEGLSRIEVFLKDKNKKSFPKMLGECLTLMIHKREIPYYYFKYLYKKEVQNIQDYLGTKEAARIHKDLKLHNPELTSIMNNKLAFAFFAEKNKLKTAKLYGYHLGPNYFSDTLYSKTDNTKGLLLYFQSLFKTSNTDRIFVKPVSDFGGKGCFILNYDNLDSQIQEKEALLLSEKHLFFEVVKQHPDINKIHPNCLNTLRIVSYIDENGQLEIISTFMRFGVDKSQVDNAASGGIFVGVNKDTGTLNERGYRSLYYGGGQFRHHPNSKFRFDGFKIPFIREAYEMIACSLEHLPDRLIGWDVAITPDGPIIIEANDTPDLHVSDLAASGLLKNNSMKVLVKNYCS